MKTVQVIGLAVFFSGISLVLAGGLGIPRKEDVPKYLKQLQTATSAPDRVKAASMLGKRGGINANDVEDAIEPLQSALQKDKSAAVRAAAARALGDIHPEASATVPLLVDRLKTDTSMDVKLASVVALGQFGPDAKEAVPPLRELATKFDMKKSKEGQTIKNALDMINGPRKKKT